MTSFCGADIKSEKSNFVLWSFYSAISDRNPPFSHTSCLLSFPPFHTHTYLLLKEVRGSKRRTTNLNFFSLDGATLLGPLVVVILKVDSSHETFGSKLKQLSSRTVKKICCGERGLPALSKKFFITVPKNFPTKVFSQKQKVLASLDKVLQLRYYYSFGS